MVVWWEKPAGCWANLVIWLKYTSCPVNEHNSKWKRFDQPLYKRPFEWVFPEYFLYTIYDILLFLMLRPFLNWFSKWRKAMLTPHSKDYHYYLNCFFCSVGFIHHVDKLDSAACSNTFNPRSPVILWKKLSYKYIMENHIKVNICATIN